LLEKVLVQELIKNYLRDATFTAREGGALAMASVLRRA
jgi:hypothetical protein